MDIVTHASKGHTIGSKYKIETRYYFQLNPPKKSDTVRLITRYSSQHREIRNIITKFWPLLFADPVVSKHINPFPEITYRRVPSLKDRLVHSHFQDTSKNKKSSHIGISPCGKCDICRYVENTSQFLLPNGQWHLIKFNATCQTPGIIYLAQCICGGFYVGKTKRPFYKRIRDHIKPILKKQMDTAIARHVGLYHNFNPRTIKFYALEHVPLDERGGSVDRTLLQLEARWIYALQATHFPGLNESLSYRPFL